MSIYLFCEGSPRDCEKNFWWLNKRVMMMPDTQVLVTFRRKNKFHYVVSGILLLLKDICRIGAPVTVQAVRFARAPPRRPHCHQKPKTRYPVQWLKFPHLQYKLKLLSDSCALRAAVIRRLFLTRVIVSWILN